MTLSRSLRVCGEVRLCHPFETKRLLRKTVVWWHTKRRPSTAATETSSAQCITVPVRSTRTSSAHHCTSPVPTLCNEAATPSGRTTNTNNVNTPFVGGQPPGSDHESPQEEAPEHGATFGGAMPLPNFLTPSLPHRPPAPSVLLFHCPRMVTCELSRVCCWLRRSQHNTQHMQITRKREKLVKSRTRPWAPFAMSVGGECKMRFCMGEEGTS